MELQGVNLEGGFLSQCYTKFCLVFISNVNSLIEEHKDLQLILERQANPSEGRRGVWHKWRQWLPPESLSDQARYKCLISLMDLCPTTPTIFSIAKLSPLWPELSQTQISPQLHQHRSAPNWHRAVPFTHTRDGVEWSFCFLRKRKKESKKREKKKGKKRCQKKKATSLSYLYSV